MSDGPVGFSVMVTIGLISEEIMAELNSSGLAAQLGPVEIVEARSVEGSGSMTADAILTSLLRSRSHRQDAQAASPPRTSP
jgi:hypothetical protein